MLSGAGWLSGVTGVHSVVAPEGLLFASRAVRHRRPHPGREAAAVISLGLRAVGSRSGRGQCVL